MSVARESLKFTLYDHIIVQNLLEGIYQFGANIPKAHGTFFVNSPRTVFMLGAQH